ncbi:MAG: hypothetical protein AAB381_02115 [Patescibacteria group bacterium]
MTLLLSKIRTAVLVSILINAPFAIGEFITRETSGPRTGFPVHLFIVLWVEMTLLAYLLTSILHTFKNRTASRKPLLLALQIILSGILAWAWVTLIIDQWPCFFWGGRGC